MPQFETKTRREILRFLGVAGLKPARTPIAAPITTVVQQDFSVPLVDKDGVITSRYNATAVNFADDLGESVRMEVEIVPGGEFLI